MNNITLITLNDGDHLMYPKEANEISLNSPASAVFTDFKIHKPLIIESSTTAIQAKYLMQKAHVRLKLVVDAHGELIGVISSAELSEQAILIQQTKGGFDRDDILVRHLMIPKVEIKALDFHKTMKASVGDVVDVLRDNSIQHCLVLEAEQHQIRGIISAADIARHLHIPLGIKKATTFVEIFQVIHRM